MSRFLSHGNAGGAAPDPNVTISNGGPTTPSSFWHDAQPLLAPTSSAASTEDGAEPPPSSVKEAGARAGCPCGRRCCGRVRRLERDSKQLRLQTTPRAIGRLLQLCCSTNSALTHQGSGRVAGHFFEGPAPGEAPRTALQRWLPLAPVWVLQPREGMHTATPRGERKPWNFRNSGYQLVPTLLANHFRTDPSGQWESRLAFLQRACAMGSTSHCIAALAPQRASNGCYSPMRA